MLFFAMSFPYYVVQDKRLTVCVTCAGVGDGEAVQPEK